MSEHTVVTVRSRSGEGPDAFGKRLTAFWSDMIRTRKTDYERVYAETTRFEPAGDRVTRQYMIEASIAELLADELTRAGIDHDPINPDDVYSKYEATPPEWFQIPH